MKLNKFKIDLLWNVLSFVISALLGIYMNSFIIKQYDISVLGVFNQNYALYLFLSQIAVGGVHLAVQRYIPEESDLQTSNAILFSALIISTCISLIVISISYIFKSIPGILMKSDGVKYGFQYVIPGLLFFSYNKILLAYINGKRMMKLYAVLYLLRFVFMIGFAIALTVLKVESYSLCILLTLAELFLFIITFIILFRQIKIVLWTEVKKWIKKNRDFGSKAMLGNILFDANTKVDILLIGVFLSDTSAGIYSFAALLVEGFAQLPVIFRNNLNPIITRCYSNKSIDVMNKVVKMNLKKLYKVLAILGFLSIASFPLILIILNVKEFLFEMWSVYAILVFGIIMTGGYQPFSMFFNQIGLPATQTRLIFAWTLVNVLLNLLFIPFLGIYGSAIGTAIANITLPIYLTKVAHKKKGVVFQLSIK